MKLRNINPLGAVDVPGIGALEAGQEFEVDDKTGKALLEQEGNYESADKPKKKG